MHAGNVIKVGRKHTRKAVPGTQHLISLLLGNIERPTKISCVCNSDALHFMYEVCKPNEHGTHPYFLTDFTLLAAQNWMTLPGSK